MTNPSAQEPAPHQETVAYGLRIWGWGLWAGIAFWAAGFAFLPWWAALLLWWWPSLLVAAAVGFLAIRLASGSRRGIAARARGP
jgi:hypothetical protein